MPLDGKGECLHVLQGALRSMHAQALHVSAAGLLPTPSLAVQIPTAKVRLLSNTLSFLVSLFYHTF